MGGAPSLDQRRGPSRTGTSRARRQALSRGSWVLDLLSNLSELVSFRPSDASFDIKAAATS